MGAQAGSCSLDPAVCESGPAPLRRGVVITTLVWALLTCLLARMAVVRPARVPQPAGSSGHEQGDDHLLERSRNTGRDTRGRPGRGDLHRTRAAARRGRQHLQGPGIEGAARHAVGLCPVSYTHLTLPTSDLV